MLVGEDTELWCTRDRGELRTLNKAKTLEAWLFLLGETRKTKDKSREKARLCSEKVRVEKGSHLKLNLQTYPIPVRRKVSIYLKPKKKKKSHCKIWFQKCDPLDLGQSEDKCFPRDIFHRRAREAPVAKTGNTSWRKIHNHFWKSQTAQGNNSHWGKVSR